MTEFWEYPVQVQREGVGGPRCVRNSRDAIVSLATDFPKDCKDAGKVRKICMNAIDGQVATEAAASAFRRLATSAGLLHR